MLKFQLSYTPTPRQIVGLSRGLIVLAVFFGVGCLEAARHPFAYLPSHLVTQTGAAALLAASVAALALAGYAAYADIDRPRGYDGPSRRR